MRVIQRRAALEKHFSYKKCRKFAERATLPCQRRKRIKIDGGVGKIPVLSQMALSKTTRVPLKEGWALRKAKIVYRFYEKKKT